MSTQRTANVTPDLNVLGAVQSGSQIKKIRRTRKDKGEKRKRRNSKEELISDLPHQNDGEKIVDAANESTAWPSQQNRDEAGKDQISHLMVKTANAVNEFMKGQPMALEADISRESLSVMTVG
ncbi:hypothetical protein HDU96_003859 [Phlyctochytrium bullatum]|nr:hypothetical protein HDU96_003859 [Phlyctochytrium bullatum]